MTKVNFIAQHINATADDLAGNNGIGRYVLLPGSDGRAHEIAQFFNDVRIKKHERGHNLYLGYINNHGNKIDVAAISSGMGCPSMEIVLHELFNLGAKRFLRIGSAGSLQPESVHVGTIINVQAAVRDEDTTSHYAPNELPAVASLTMTNAIIDAATKLNLNTKLVTGIVHCKSALYAREFAAGPLSSDNKKYIHMLKSFGVLASEMETSTLFIQSQFYNQQLLQLRLDSQKLQHSEQDNQNNQKLLSSGQDNQNNQILLQSGHRQTLEIPPQYKVLASAILTIVSETDVFDNTAETRQGMIDSIQLGLETIKVLSKHEAVS